MIAHASTATRVGLWQYPRFQDEALVAGAAGYLFAIEILEEGDGVFAGDTGEVFEGSDVDQPVGLVLRGVGEQLVFEFLDHLRVHEHLALNANHFSIIDEKLQELSSLSALRGGDVCPSHD